MGVIDDKLDEASAFGVYPTRTTTFSERSSTALFVIEISPDAIANGGSVIVDTATAVYAATTASSDVIPIDPTTVNTAAAVMTSSTTGAASAVGGLFGMGGFIVGALTTGGKRRGESQRLEGIITEQNGKVKELNTELEAAKQKLTVAIAESDENISQLEKRFFVMDIEFEESTAELKRDFEVRVQREIETRSDKLKQDLKFSYDIKMMREREQMLQEKLRFIEMESSGSSLAKQEEATMAKLELAQSRQEIMTLETNLNKSTSEVQELRSMMEESNRNFLGINSAAGLRLKLSDLQKKIVRMEETLLEKEEQIIKGEEEIEKLQTKSNNNPLYFVKEMFQKTTTNNRN